MVFLSRPIEFLRRAFTIPLARRRALRELMEREAERHALMLLKALLVHLDTTKPSESLARRLVTRAEMWVYRQTGPVGRLLQLGFPMIRDAIVQEASRVDESLEERLREALTSAIARILR